MDKIFIHPDFAPMQGADIALIRLQKTVPGIPAVSCYREQDEAGQDIIIVGHGDFKTGKGGDWRMDGIKRGATNIIDQTTLDKIIFDFDEPPAGTELEGTAGRGDSGGPAFILQNNMPFLAGISSAGMPGKQGPGTYGAIEHYTRVSSYLDWISETMENPKDGKTLSKARLSQSGKGRTGSPKIRRGEGGPLPGLGLMLWQENKRIFIGGKADPMVPKAFRQLMFRSPSFIESFNGKSYTSLVEFKKDFDKVKKSQVFTIQFNIQGKSQTFEAQKL